LVTKNVLSINTTHLVVDTLWNYCFNTNISQAKIYRLQKSTKLYKHNKPSQDTRLNDLRGALAAYSHCMTAYCGKKAVSLSDSF